MTETETKSEAHAGVIRTWCRDPMLMAALITVIANVVIAIGAVGVVLVQGVQLSDKHEKQLRHIENVLVNTGSLRRALNRPMEGWWNYDVEYSRFHGLAWREDDKRTQFSGYGTAVFTYDEGKEHYDVLVSYLISNGLDELVVAARTEGYTDVGKVLQPGDEITMDYKGRLGLDLDEFLEGVELPTDDLGETQKYSAEKTKEPYITWTVIDDPDNPDDDLKIDREGRVAEFTAIYKGSVSEGVVTFTRRP